MRYICNKIPLDCLNPFFLSYILKKTNKHLLIRFNGKRDKPYFQNLISFPLYCNLMRLVTIQRKGSINGFQKCLVVYNIADLLSLHDPLQWKVLIYKRVCI